jgi:hypothetical protein
VAQGADAGPLPPLRRVMTLLLPAHPFAPFRTQHTLLGPIDPADIDAGACEKLQVDLACNGERRRTRSDGTRGLDKSTTGLSRNTRQIPDS